MFRSVSRVLGGDASHQGIGWTGGGGGGGEKERKMVSSSVFQQLSLHAGQLNGGRGENKDPCRLLDVLFLQLLFWK